MSKQTPALQDLKHRLGVLLILTDRPGQVNDRTGEDALSLLTSIRELHPGHKKELVNDAVILRDRINKQYLRPKGRF